MKNIPETERTGRCMICHQYIDLDRHSYAKVAFDQLIYYVHRRTCLREAQKDHPHLTILDLVAGKGRRTGTPLEAREEDLR